MEMEHINENTIRVLIGNEDLAARGITFLDLLGNQKQIENFFYSILEEVDVEEQFQGSDAVTFQVLPNRDGLELFISKNTGDGESIDFSGLSESTGADGFADYIKQQMFKDKNDTTEDYQDEVDEYLESNGSISELVFQVADFEDLVQLAKEVYLQNSVSSLYEMNGNYFLKVTFLLEETTTEQIEIDRSLLLEYTYETPVTPEILSEYGNEIVERSALELLRYYFK